jgi:fructosamine-3-kinase
MTKLFGANSKSFYEKYFSIVGLKEGYELREVIYNLYHILNHYVLFGGGYLMQANVMISKILKA